MKKIIFLIVCGLFLCKPAYPEDKKPIGDFFHGKKAEYKIEFKALFAEYNVSAVIDFYKIGDDGYLTKFYLDKNYVKYVVETVGIIHDNKLYPDYTEEKIKFAGFNYTTKYKYRYDENYNLKKVRIVHEGSTGFKTETYLTNFSKNHTTDLLSGVLQLIYWAYCFNDLYLLPLNIVRDDYILRGMQIKTYEKNGVKYAKLKNEEQEENFDLINLLAKIGKNNWPELITVDEHWILKNIRITLMHLQ